MTDSKTSREPTRVGIVGGGLCGCSTAYFLRKLMGPNVSITLFERSDRLGGRIRGEKVGDKLYETGGTIFLSSHKYINSFVNEFGLEKINYSAGPRALAFYDGNRHISFTTLQRPSFMTKLKFLWLYGRDFFKFKQHTRKTAETFAKIYDQQDEGKCFGTPADLLTSLSADFLRMTGVTFGNWLENIIGLRRRFCEEIAYGTVSLCYGQNLNLHAFAGMLASAGGGATLYSLLDGNEQLPRLLLRSALRSNPADSPRFFVNADVKTLSPGKSRRFRLEYTTESDPKVKSAEFDYVVLAHPLNQGASISAPKGLLPPPSEYKTVDSTLICGELAPEQFGFPSDESFEHLKGFSILPTKRGFEDDRNTLFNALMKVRSVAVEEIEDDGAPCCWVSYSLPDRCLEPGQDMSSTYFKKGPNPSKTMGKFILSPGLIYANALERAACCMEIAIISARNAALIIHTETSGKQD
ncbi:hypothetical protein AAHC03_01625 [Spirometra sp. Aus1]